MRENLFSNVEHKSYRLRNIIGISDIYIAVSLFFYFHFRENLYYNMVWNVFLAFLPLLFANALLYISAEHGGHSRVMKIILFILWLLFFPNSIYMLTDFIHILGYPFYSGQLWIRIVYIGIGFFMGILFGLLSLRIIHRLLCRRFTSWVSQTLCMAVIFLLTGYGIYLGRFVRLNSWNVIHLGKVLNAVASSGTMFAFEFTLIYAFFTCVCYIIYCVLCPDKEIC